MSVYRCNSCGNYVDADYDGCAQDPQDYCALICLACEEDLACFHCGETKKENEYCKITDQYYCQTRV